MIKLFRELQRGEFFVVAADLAQGGGDSCVCQFLSKSRTDVPMVAVSKDVAANFTTLVHDLLEYVFDKTGVKLVVAFERNNGGTSELERLNGLNRNQKYVIYQAKNIGTVEGMSDTQKLGWDTSAQTRPQMLGDLKQAIDGKLIRVYDQDTVDELGKFIVNKKGRAEAAANTHDDAVMALAIAWQLYQTEVQEAKAESLEPFVPRWAKGGL